MKIIFANTDDKRDNNFSFTVENGKSDFLFVLFKSSCEVYLDGDFVKAGFGNGIIFSKYTKICYRCANDQNFNHDYLIFDIENDFEKALLSSLPQNRVLNFSNPQTLSYMLSLIKNELFHTDAQHKSEILTLLSHSFFYKIKDSIIYKADGLNIDKHQAFLQLRADIYKNPQKEWTIEVLSQKVFLSRSYMQHTYKKLFGVSCNEDIINARISYAKSLLLATDLTINQIGEKCGYKNLTHFIRQFKAKTGISPNMYRKTKA